MITAAVHRGLPGLLGVREAWGRLLSELVEPAFFQLHVWHEAYLRCLEPAPDDFVVLELRRDGQTTGFLPLRAETTRVLGIRIPLLALPSHTQAPLAGIVLRDSERLADYRRAMADAAGAAALPWDALRLERLPAGSPGLAELGSGGAWPWPLAVWRASFNSIPCAQPFEKIAEGWSKNFRGNLRKARNKLKAAGEVRYVSTRGDQADFEGCLARFLEVEASGWKGAQGRASAIGLDPRLAGFYRTLGRLAPQGACEVNLLLLDDRCLAGQFCVRAGGTVNVLKIGYSEEHARLAPGNMLMEELLKRAAAAADVRSVSFVSDSSWHRDWRPQATDVYDRWLFNRTLRGATAWAWMAGRDAAKRALRGAALPARGREGDRSAKGLAAAGQV